MKKGTLIMSKDYDALHAHLEKGLEALGLIDKKEFGKYENTIHRAPVRIIPSVTEDGELRIEISNNPLSSTEFWGSKETFMSECARLNLEWIAPTPTPVPPPLSEEDIERMTKEVYPRSTTIGKFSYFYVSCPHCDSIFLSRNSEGCNPIADTGDYSEMLCPHCFGRAEEEIKDLAIINVARAAHRNALRSFNAFGR